MEIIYARGFTILRVAFHGILIFDLIICIIYAGELFVFLLDHLYSRLVEELENMRQRANAQQAHQREQRQQQIAATLMADVRALGHWPRSLQGASHTTERRLAARVRQALTSGSLSKADEAELEEMRWMHVRACQAAA